MYDSACSNIENWLQMLAVLSPSRTWTQVRVHKQRVPSLQMLKAMPERKPLLAVYGFCGLKYFMLTFCWHNKVGASCLLVLEWSCKAEALLTDLLVSGQLYLGRHLKIAPFQLPYIFCSSKPRENGRNIVECHMLRPFAHPFSCWWELLRKVWNRSNF